VTSTNADIPTARLHATLSVGELTFCEMHYDAGFVHPPHHHSQTYLDLALTGTRQASWDAGSGLLMPLALIHLPSGVPHNMVNLEENKSFQVVIPEPWLSRVRQVGTVDGSPRVFENSAPGWLVARMYREFKTRDDLTPLALEGMLLEFWPALLRQASTVGENGRLRWLQQASDYLHAYFTESISPDAVAMAIGVHPAHLMRSFRQYYRCTMGDYVRNLRVEQACHLLATSDVTLSEVAHSVGFYDQSHFNRNFRMVTGMTPKAFLRSINSNSRKPEM
jgi:AraC family transcriptional regulator